MVWPTRRYAEPRPTWTPVSRTALDLHRHDENGSLFGPKRGLNYLPRAAIVVRMLVSLREQIEAAIAAGNLFRKASGEVTDWAELYDPANLALLDNEHDGVFAFLAF